MINIKSFDGIFICTCFVEIGRFFFKHHDLSATPRCKNKTKNKRKFQGFNDFFLKVKHVKKPKHPNWEHHEITTLV